MWAILRNRKAQAILEYALIFAAVVGAVVLMGIYYRRSVNAKLKRTALGLNATFNNMNVIVTRPLGTWTPPATPGPTAPADIDFEHVRDLMAQGSSLMERGSLLITEGNDLISQGNTLISDGNARITQGKVMLDDADPSNDAEGQALIDEGNQNVADGNAMVADGNAMVAEGEELKRQGQALIDEANAILGV